MYRKYCLVRQQMSHLSRRSCSIIPIQRRQTQNYVDIINTQSGILFCSLIVGVPFVGGVLNNSSVYYKKIRTRYTFLYKTDIYRRILVILFAKSVIENLKYQRFYHIHPGYNFVICIFRINNKITYSTRQQIHTFNGVK